MKVKRLKFPNLAINCVGADRNINDVIQFFKIQDRNTGVILENLLCRIILNNVFAYAEGNGITAKLDAGSFNKKLANEGLLINEADFVDAMFVCHPDEMSSILQIEEETKAAMLENSIWKDKI